MPHLDQPEEKEGKKEEGEQTHTNASPPTSKMKILQGRLRNGKLIQFEDNISSNKDDGGLVALGITRKQMCDALQELQNDETYRKILRKEIGHAVKTNKIIIDDITIKVCKEIYDKEQIALTNLLKEIKQNVELSSEERNYNAEKLIECLSKKGYYDSAKALERKNNEFCHSEKQLDDYCQNLEIFQSYVASVSNGLEVGIKSAILYAKVDNIILCIWQKNTQKNTKNPYDLGILDVHEADSPATANTIHLFQFDNSIDFKLLTVADSKNAIEFSKQGNEESQSSFQPLVGSINNDNVDDIDDDNRNYNNSANSQPSQISSVYSWVSRKWNRHEIPTKFFLKFCQNSLDWKNFVTSFTEGARWALDLWPPVFLGILAHDYIVYGHQPENRYGATWDNILLGNAPNELSWASQFGSYFPTEFNYWLLPFLVPATMFTAGIFKAVWNCSRSRPFESNEKRITSPRNYKKIDFFNDTVWWYPLSHRVNLLSRLEFLLLHDTGLNDDDRATIFKDIQLLAKDYHSLARLNAMSSLANIANSNKKENNDALATLRDQAKQGNYYAKYLLWTLGETQNTKQNTSKKHTAQDIGLHALFWVTSLCFNLRLSASLGFKFRDWIKYKENQAACETNSKGANSNYTWALVPEIANYQCVIPGCNSPDFYYPYRSNTQDCLNAFLSEPHSASDIKTFVENLPGTFDSVSFKNQSWYTWSPDDLKSVLDVFAKRFPILKMFDLSIDQYEEIIIDNGIIDVLTKFFQEMGILQIDIHNLGVGANVVNQILVAIYGTVTEWFDLSKTGSDDSVTETLKNIMPHTFFKVIKAAGNYFTDNGIGYLMKGAENSTLIDLVVSANPFGALGWNFISNSLPKTQLKTLAADDVESSQADLGALGKAVAQTPTLENISLQRTNIGDKQIDEFSLEAKSSNLKALDISGTAVTGNGASNAVRNFKNSTLEEINLGSLPIQGKDLNNISEKLRDTNIKSLGIPNIQVTPSEFCQFTTSLNQTSVTSLNVEKNAFGDQGAGCLKDAIEAPNSKLENINYSDNQASKNGGQKIMQAVAESDKVRVINLSKNSFAGLDGEPVKNMLQQNQQLEAVILDDTNIGPEVGDGIANGLLEAKQLKQLSVNDNPNLGNTANKNITQSLIKPIANMDKLGSKLSNDQLRDLYHAENQTQLEYLGIEKTGLEDDGALGYCQVWPTTHNALDQLQAKNNLVNPNKVNMENCQTSDASKISLGNLEKYFTAGYIFYNLIDHFFTDHREWTLDDNDRKQIERYKTRLEYLKNQHKPQITSTAVKNPHLNYLFERIADLCYAVTAILARVEKTKELSDAILEAIKERIAAIEKNIQEISQYNKAVRSKHNKERRQRFEKRCKRTGEPGVVVTRRNVLTGKVTQKFFVATDAKTTEFLKANKQALALETKTKFVRFTEMQQFWQLQQEPKKLQTNLKNIEFEQQSVLQLDK